MTYSQTPETFWFDLFWEVNADVAILLEVPKSASFFCHGEHVYYLGRIRSSYPDIGNPYLILLVTSQLSN